MSEIKEMRAVYRDFLKEESIKNGDIVVLEADLSSSMATAELKSILGDRYINVGIMEAEMVGCAAGLSILGFKPYLHTFGPFASRRVYDQIFVSLAYARLNATIIGSDAGIAAEMNGGTHMPFEEITLMRAIPGIHLYEVSDDIQFRAVLQETLQHDGLNYIRTIRKKPYRLYEDSQDFSKGYCVVHEGQDAVIVASGIMVEEALKAAKILEQQNIQVSVVDVFRIKPLNSDIIRLLSNRPIVTVENHSITGGLGSAITELMSEHSPTTVKRMGVVNQFGQVGQLDYLKKEYKLAADDIASSVIQVLN